MIEFIQPTSDNKSFLVFDPNDGQVKLYRSFVIPDEDEPIDLDKLEQFSFGEHEPFFL